MPTIKTRQISVEAVETIERLSATRLEEKFRNGDFLYMMGIAFKMVYYSAEDFDGQSRYVNWWSELYNIEIHVDRAENIVTVRTPVIDHRKDGF
jgi:hypothetical protein